MVRVLKHPEHVVINEHLPNTKKVKVKRDNGRVMLGSTSHVFETGTTLVSSICTASCCCYILLHPAAAAVLHKGPITSP